LCPLPSYLRSGAGPPRAIFHTCSCAFASPKSAQGSPFTTPLPIRLLSQSICNYYLIPSRNVLGGYPNPLNSVASAATTSHQDGPAFETCQRFAKPAIHASLYG
jgi:hypothetical protein